MAEDRDDIPEADRLEGAPHPRETIVLHGHADAERLLLDAYRSGRMHHAWILGGAPGVGKATLAYRMARFVLAHPEPEAEEVRQATDLSVDPENPTARRIARMAHPDLAVLRRAWSPERKTIPAEIRVDDVRRVVSFFGTTAGAGGWRVAIVDTAEDLNISGANALLKVLEEPPPRSLFLILSTAPKRLLPTIRSRCRTLELRPLEPDQIEAVLRGPMAELTDGLDAPELAELAGLSGGSVRTAATLIDEDSRALRGTLDAVLNRLPEIDAAASHALAEKVAARDGGVAFSLFVAWVLDWLHERVQSGAGAGEPRLARWAELWDKTAHRARKAETYNLDRRPLVLGIINDLAAAVRGGSSLPRSGR